MPLVDGMTALDEALEAPEWNSLGAVRTAIRKQLTQRGAGATNSSEEVINHWSLEMMGVLNDMNSAKADAMRDMAPGDRRAWKVCEEGPEHRAMVRKGPEGTEVHTLLMEGIVNGPVEAAVAMTRDVTFFKEWWPQQNMPVYKVIENRYLKRIGDGFDLTYMRFRTPWPFPGKEFAFMLLSVYDANTGMVTTVLQTPPEDNTLINPAKHGFPREAVPPVPSGVVRMAINGGFTVKDLGENRCHYRGIFTVDLKMPPALVNFVTKGFGGMLFTVFSKEIESDLADIKGGKGKAFRKVLEEEQLYVRIREAMCEHRARKEKQRERVGGGSGGGGAVAAAAGMGDDGEEEERWDGGESEAFYSPASSFSSFHAHALPHLSLDHAAASEPLHPHATEGTHLREAAQMLPSHASGMQRRTSGPPRFRSSISRGRSDGPAATRAAAAAEAAEAEAGGSAGWVGRGRFGFRSSRRKAEERARKLTETTPPFLSSLPTPSSPAASLASSLSQARLEDLGLIPVDSASTSSHEAASYQPHHSDLCQQLQPGDFDRIVAGGASESKGVFGSSGKGNVELGSKTGGGMFGSSWRFGSSSSRSGRSSSNSRSRRDSDGGAVRRKVPGSPGLGLWWKKRSSRVADCSSYDDNACAEAASAGTAAPQSQPPPMWLESPVHMTSRRGSTGSTGSTGSGGMTGTGSSTGSSSSSWSASPVLWEERRVSEAGNSRRDGAGGLTAAGVLSPGWESGSTHSSQSTRSSSSRGSSSVRNRGASSPVHEQVKGPAVLAAGGDAAFGAPVGKGYGRYCDVMPKQQLEVKRRQATERRFLNFLKGGLEFDFTAS